MIDIPNNTKTLKQLGTSDWFGNIWYTKNINFDEQGYIKLASRTVQFLSEADDANFDTPISFGRATGEFHIVTADSPYDLSILESDFSITEDTNTNNPTLTADSWGKWFQNRWHATTATGMWYTTGGSWTDTGVSITSGKVHCLEVFPNKNSICVSNGNTVKLLDTSYATTVTLTIPTDFEIIKMAYSNFKMGIATMLSDTVSGQNQEAYFFIWDGVSTSAEAGYPMGSDTIISIIAHNSSWLLLTRNGEWKYFNGGGFETIGFFPFAYKNTTWGDSQNRISFGDIIKAEKDKLFANIGNSLSNFGRKGESYLQNYPAGIYCYDPNVGFHHRYSPSISPAYQIVVSSANVNTTTDIITATSGTIPATGNPIKLIDNTGTPIGGITPGRGYYVIRHSSTTFSLATTRQNAIDAVKVDLTSQADARFMAVSVLDYGSSIQNRCGGVAVMESRLETCDHMVFGAETKGTDTTNYARLCLTTAGFENRGYFVTAKIPSTEVEDIISKIYLKYRALDINDKIIVKYKDADIIGIPTSTPQHPTTSYCTWSDSNTLTTTADLSEIKTYLDADSENECEVEIIGGAGAGQMSQISSITESNGTYTVNLVDEIEGATATYACDIIIDNWKLLKTVADESYLSSTNTLGWAEFPVNSTSKWIMFKVELRGSETCIEELKSINKLQTLAK